MKKYVYMILALAAVFWVARASASGLEPCSGGILISREIRPFIRMVQTLEDELDLAPCRMFLDKAGEVYSLDSRFKSIDTQSWDFIVAVGPAALKYLSQKQKEIETQVFYGMVLNPDRIISSSLQIQSCGVSLDLFTVSRLEKLKSTLPDTNRMALFYNPEENSMARKIVNRFDAVDGMESVPVEVFSEPGIKKAVRNVAPTVDAFYFIPDQTVISPAIVKYIIRYGIRHDIPSIGYNRFFHESGALLSYTLDYKGIGRQAASLITRFIETGECLSTEPDAFLLYNGNVADLLNIKVNEEFIEAE